MENNNNNYYYQIHVVYEVPYNVFDDSNGSDVLKARDEIYGKLLNAIPEKYEKFSAKLTLHQLRDNYNYIVCYEALFRSTEGLPMEEYVSSRGVKETVEKYLEEFFKAIDCDYRKLNVKTIP